VNREEVKVVLLTQNKNLKYLYGSALPEKTVNFVSKLTVFSMKFAYSK